LNQVKEEPAAVPSWPAPIPTFQSNSGSGLNTQNNAGNYAQQTQQPGYHQQQQQQQQPSRQFNGFNQDGDRPRHMDNNDEG
jgi:hypothetical protein